MPIARYAVWTSELPRAHCPRRARRSGGIASSKDPPIGEDLGAAGEPRGRRRRISRRSVGYEAGVVPGREQEMSLRRVARTAIPVMLALTCDRAGGRRGPTAEAEAHIDTVAVTR